MLTGLLMSVGLGPKLAKFASYGIMIAVAVAALLWWGHTKYEAGVRDTDQKWELASAKLMEKAAHAATRADVQAKRRVEQFTAIQAEEKEKLDEAEREGSSPLDVLFGPGGM